MKPRDLGFTEAIVVTPRTIGQIETAWRGPAADWQPVVYLMMCQERVFRVGQTSRPLWQRWLDYRRVMRDPEDRRLRANEQEDGRRIWRITGGAPFSIWAKAPATTTMSYIPGHTMEVPLREAEEAYLKAYYQPEFGR